MKNMRGYEVISLSKADAAKLRDCALFQYMEDVGIPAITLEKLNHERARPVHGLKKVFCIDE